MKKWIALALATLLVLCLAAPGLAEEAGDGFLGRMVVVRCEEWVSLRAAPSTSAERLAKVPLGAMVDNCHAYDYTFVYCEYEGKSGYILSDYLQPLALPLTLDIEVNGLRVTAVHDYEDGIERLSVTVTDPASGAVRWTRTVTNSLVTELDGLAAFLGGTQADPRVMLFDTEGLASLKLDSGEEVWRLSREACGLHAGVSAMAGPDGTLYAGGYYGPDPVAISMDGQVLWRAQGDDDLYWLYYIDVTNEGVVAYYDSGEEPTAVCYGWDGNVLWGGK